MNVTALKELHELNDAQIINKLPPEILGWIFILAAEEQHRSRKPFSKDIGLQDTVVVSALLILVYQKRS